MSIGPLSSLSSAYLQSLFGVTASSATNNTTNRSAAASLAMPQDDNRLSPFAQLLSSLQQLQQSDPAKYKQVAQQIGDKLQSAAKTAATNGDTRTADELNKLATDFTSSAKSGDLPNVQDLAQALTQAHGHHRHHHHQDAGSTSPASSSIAAASSSATDSQSTDPLAIILGALTDAGVTPSQ